MSQNKSICTIMQRNAFAALASGGMVNGLSNRARTQRSAKDKARCPKRQRQQFRAERWG